MQLYIRLMRLLFLHRLELEGFRACSAWIYVIKKFRLTSRQAMCMEHSLQPKNLKPQNSMW